MAASKLPRDIQIDRVSTPRTVLKDASLLVDVVVTQTGYAGRTVTVDVEDEGRIVGSQKVQLPVGRQSRDGPRSARPPPSRVRALFKFKVAPQEGEVVTQNNVRESLVNVRDAREQILYFEGEPRFEMKFLRRAVADDKNLRGRRAAADRRQQVHASSASITTRKNCVGGFPKTREELFAYRGLILGSVEAGGVQRPISCR